MNLYLVRNPDGVPVWVAFESDQKRLYTYVQSTGKGTADGLVDSSCLGFSGRVSGL
jgi:hypothetical protein